MSLGSDYSFNAILHVQFGAVGGFRTAGPSMNEQEPNSSSSLGQKHAAVGDEYLEGIDLEHSFLLQPIKEALQGV